MSFIVRHWPTMDTNIIFPGVLERYVIFVGIIFDRNCLQLKFLINKTILLEPIFSCFCAFLKDRLDMLSQKTELIVIKYCLNHDFYFDRWFYQHQNHVHMEECYKTFLKCTHHVDVGDWGIGCQVSQAGWY